MHLLHITHTLAHMHARKHASTHTQQTPTSMYLHVGAEGVLICGVGEGQGEAPGEGTGER